MRAKSYITPSSVPSIPSLRTAQRETKMLIPDLIIFFADILYIEKGTLSNRAGEKRQKQAVYEYR